MRSPFAAPIAHRSGSHAPQRWPSLARTRRPCRRSRWFSGRVALPRPRCHLRKDGQHVSVGVELLRVAQQLDRVGLDHRVSLPQPRMPRKKRPPGGRIRLQMVRRNVRRLRRQIHPASSRLQIARPHLPVRANLSGRLHKRELLRRRSRLGIAHDRIPRQQRRLARPLHLRLVGLRASLPFAHLHVAIQVNLRPIPFRSKIRAQFPRSYRLCRPSGKFPLHFRPSIRSKRIRLAARREFRRHPLAAEPRTAPRILSRVRPSLPFQRCRGKSFRTLDPGALFSAGLGKMDQQFLRPQLARPAASPFGAISFCTLNSGSRVSSSDAAVNPRVPSTTWTGPDMRSVRVSLRNSRRVPVTFVCPAVLPAPGRCSSNSTLFRSCTTPSPDSYATPAALAFPCGNWISTASSVFASPLSRSKETLRVSTCTTRAACPPPLPARRASSALSRSICTTPVQ